MRKAGRRLFFIRSKCSQHSDVECLLVDDTPLNVDRAEAAGWQALLFRDAAQLKGDLNNLLHYRNV